MKFLNFCVRNKVMIVVIVFIIEIIAISTSVFVFGNDYYNTKFHWLISFLGLGIIWFVSFCIVDAEKLEDKNPNKESDNSKEPKQNK